MGTVNTEVDVEFEFDREATSGVNWDVPCGVTICEGIPLCSLSSMILLELRAVPNQSSLCKLHCFF
jgi:hypothetical protein